MSFARRRTHHDQYILRRDPETLPQTTIRLKRRKVDIFFKARVRDDSRTIPHLVFRKHAGNHEPSRFDERQFRAEFVIHQRHGGNPQQIAC